MEGFIAALGPLWGKFSIFWKVTFWSELSKISTLGFFEFLKKANPLVVTIVLVIILAPIM